jgi:oligopeptidase B
VRGLDRIEVRYYDDPTRIEPITSPRSYDAGLADNPEWAVDKLRVTYESMVSPATSMTTPWRTRALKC